jgi:hypothetical protein
MAQLEIRSTRWRWKGFFAPRLVALIGVISPILCVLVFTLAGFLRPVISRRWLLASTILLMLSGAGVTNEGIFHQPAHGDPAARLFIVIHGIGLAVLFYSLIIALLIIGWHLCKTPTWRRYGWYLLLTALATFGLLVIPTQIAGSGHIGGFIERTQVIVGFAWSVVIGWRLFTHQHQAA